MSGARRRPGLLVALAGLAAIAALWPQGAGAIPGGGSSEIPGTPPGTVEVTTPTVEQKGSVGFCVRNFRVEKGGTSVGQEFMVKFDDFGDYGMGPFKPDAEGNLCAAVSTDPAAHAGERGGAKDKIPSDLCNPGKEHWLRFLSGSWAQEGSPRSLAAAFQMSGACETSPPPSQGGGGTGTGPGSTPATPTVQLLGGKLALFERAATVRLRAGGATSAGQIVLRPRHKLRLGGPRSHRGRPVLARGTYSLPAGKARTVRIALTASGQRLLESRHQLAVSLTLRQGGTTVLAAKTTLTRGG